MTLLSQILLPALGDSGPDLWPNGLPLTLNDKIAALLPKPEEEKWRTVGWRANLMAAREEAQRAHKPIFLWIMVGNPQGCT